jgi:hypothetical protein
MYTEETGLTLKHTELHITYPPKHLCHGVERVLSLLQSSELGLPNPLTRRRACPPPLWFRGWGGGFTVQTRLREREWGGGPNFNEGTDPLVFIVIYVHMYFKLTHTCQYTDHSGIFLDAYINGKQMILLNTLATNLR